MSSDAHVLCPCSAAEFWIQLTPAVIKEIDELIEDLSPDEEESNISWTIGNPCLAVDPSHEIIFRALVTSIQGTSISTIPFIETLIFGRLSCNCPKILKNFANFSILMLIRQLPFEAMGILYTIKDQMLLNAVDRELYSINY